MHWNNISQQLEDELNGLRRLIRMRTNSTRENRIDWTRECRNLINKQQTIQTPVSKIADLRGNPIHVSGVVNYRFVNMRTAVVEVEDVQHYILNHALAVLKKVCSQYPYESTQERYEDVSLRGDPHQQVRRHMQDELAGRLIGAGVQVNSFALSEMQYSPEIAAIMLIKQQAQAMISARKQIVGGATQIVIEAVSRLRQLGIEFGQEAIDRLSSNLIVTICGEPHGHATHHLKSHTHHHTNHNQPQYHINYTSEALERELRPLRAMIQQNRYVNTRQQERNLWNKTQTIHTPVSQIVDLRGNPIHVSGVVTFRFLDLRTALVAVENIQTYILNQALTVIKQVCAQYPYESNEDSHQDISLRGEPQQIKRQMQDGLQQRLHHVGVLVTSFDLSEMQYAPEIAGMMLIKQQAQAMITARKQIVAGATQIVHEAVWRLRELGVEFSQEAVERLGSNLIISICGETHIQHTMLV